MRRIVRGVLAVGVLVVALASRAYADPVTVRGFVFVDSEGPALDFDLSGIVSGVPFRVTVFGGLPPLPAGLTLGCEPRCAPGSTFDFSNATTGLQLLSIGTLMVGDSLQSNVNFIGALTFRSPGAVLPGPPIDLNDPGARLHPSAPFTFTGTLIAQQEGGPQLFSANLIGTGQASTSLFWDPTTLAFRINEAQGLSYLFDAAQPTPEPGSLLLVATGIVGVSMRRRRATAAPARVSS